MEQNDPNATSQAPETTTPAQALPIDALRLLSKHKVHDSADDLMIQVLDEPSASGSSHDYLIDGFDHRLNPVAVPLYNSRPHVRLLFQHGHVDAAGRNGVTVEALLAVVIDHLEGRQAGRNACDEHGAALKHIERAMDYLHARTRRRLAAGTEGTAAGA